MMSAVAGAIKRRSALSASSICPGCQLAFSSKMLVVTGWRGKVCKGRGVMNCVAPAVITTCTSRSCLVNLLAMSAALYAAIEAVIPSTMFIGPSFNILDLLADLFQFGFAVNDNLRDFGVVRFCAE